MAKRANLDYSKCNGDPYVILSAALIDAAISEYTQAYVELEKLTKSKGFNKLQRNKDLYYACALLKTVIEFEPWFAESTIPSIIFDSETRRKIFIEVTEKAKDGYVKVYANTWHKYGEHYGEKTR